MSQLHSSQDSSPTSPSPQSTFFNGSSAYERFLDGLGTFIVSLTDALGFYAILIYFYIILGMIGGILLVLNQVKEWLVD